MRFSTTPMQCARLTVYRHYGVGQASYDNVGPEYPTSTSPQNIPRVDTSFYSGEAGRPNSIWDAPRSPASSDVSSNASSPMGENFGDGTYISVPTSHDY